MVNRGRQSSRSGIVLLELAVAVGMIAATLLPIAYSIVQEQRLARAYYFRAVAISLVDGEMEVLAAGAWRAFDPGRHPYQVQGESVQSLPPGQFTLDVSETGLRLEWMPAKAKQGGSVTRTIAFAPEGSPTSEDAP